MIIKPLPLDDEILGHWIATTISPPYLWTILQYSENEYGVLVEHSTSTKNDLLIARQYLEQFTHLNKPILCMDDAAIRQPSTARFIQCSLSELKAAFAKLNTEGVWIV